MKQGAVHTEEARALISEKMRGRKKSEETRMRMAFAASVRWARERQHRKEAKEQKPLFVDVSPAHSISETFEGTK